MRLASLFPALLAVVGMTGPSVVAAATSIDFDEITVPNVLRPFASDHYIDRGVLFSTDAPYHLAVHQPPQSSYIHTPPNALASIVDSGSWGTITLTFVNPGTSEPVSVGWVSVHVADAPHEAEMPWRVEAFDSRGARLDQITGTGSNVQARFTRAARDIARVSFTPSPDAELIDTISFETVPEPTWALAWLFAPMLLRRRTWR